MCQFFSSIPILTGTYETNSFLLPSSDNLNVRIIYQIMGNDMLLFCFEYELLKCTRIQTHFECLNYLVNDIKAFKT